MDNYDVVIERTVRDLFKSSPLNQIKKYKQNKEKDMNKKDEELRNLILAKYPVLISSISSLEKISASLNNLQEIRVNFGSHIEKMEKNLQNKNVYEFNKNLFLEYQDGDAQNEYDLHNLEENLKENLDEAWRNLNTEKNYQTLLMSLISISKKLNSNKRLDSFITENFEFLLVEFMESLMKEFLEHKMENKKMDNLSFENYFMYFFGIFYLIRRKKKLNLSEFYLKLQMDENIQKYFQEIFKFENNSDKNLIYTTLELILKLILLKLSKCFNVLSNNSLSDTANPALHKEEELMTALLDIFRATYQVVQILYESFSLKDVQVDEYYEGDESDSEEKEIKPSYCKKTESIFNFKKILKNLQLIFSTQEEELQFLDVNNNRTELIRNFTSFIKDEINRNFYLESKVILGNGTDEGVITFWIKTFNKIDFVFELKQTNSEMLDLLKEDLNKEDIDSNDDEHFLFNFLFLGKIMEHLNNVFSAEFSKFEFDNFKNEKKEIISFVKLYSEVYNLNANLDVYKNKNLIKTITDLLSQYTSSHLERSELKIKENFNNSKVSSYVNFLVNLYSNKKVKFYINQMKFETILNMIKRISQLFFENELKEIEHQMTAFRKHLLVENYMDEKCYEIDSNNFNTNSLIEISDYLKNNHNFEELEFDDKDYSKEKIKSKILELIIKNYFKEVMSLLDKSEDIMNKRIINDFLILQETVKEHTVQGITLEQKVNESLNEIISKFSNLYNINAIKELQEINKIKENNFFLFFNPCAELPSSSNKKAEFLLKKDDISNLPAIKETIPFPNRLNIYMISQKLLLPKIKKQSQKQGDQNNQLNVNSTSKLIDFRIDENYLSFKSSMGLNRQESQNSNQSSKNTANPSPKKQPNANTENRNNTTNITRNANIVNKVTPTHLRDPSQVTSNLSGYFRNIGGLLKDNFSNIKDYYINTNNPGQLGNNPGQSGNNPGSGNK